MEQRTVVGEIMITQEEITKRAAEIGHKITEDYQGESVILHRDSQRSGSLDGGYHEGH